MQTSSLIGGQIPSVSAWLVREPSFWVVPWATNHLWYTLHTLYFAQQ